MSTNQTPNLKGNGRASTGDAKAGKSDQDAIYYSTKDEALMAAWRRLLDYDSVSSSQKRMSQTIRAQVIGIQLLISTLAIGTTYLDGPQWMINVSRLLLVVMPVVSVALMNYATRFASSTAWIEYRVSAEMIRAAILKYRTQSEQFLETEPGMRQGLLLKTIKEADDRIDIQDGMVAPPYIQTHTHQVVSSIQESQKRNGLAEDDGVSQMDSDKYVKHRAEHQLTWFIDKVKNDYERWQSDERLALAVSGAGSIFAALGFGLEALVALTTAASVALTSRSDIKMYGATYNIYHNTARNLQYALDEWKIKTPEQRRDPQEISNFVKKVEHILHEDLQAWKEQSKLVLKSTDRRIMSQLETQVQADDSRLKNTAINDLLVESQARMQDDADGEPKPTGTTSGQQVG